MVLLGTSYTTSLNFNTSDGATTEDATTSIPIIPASSTHNLTNSSFNTTYLISICSSGAPGSHVLLYVFLPVLIIFIFGGTVLVFKYTKRRSGARRLRKQLVPLRQYDVSTDLEQDENLVEVKLVEPCCNDPLLAFKPAERPDSLAVQNVS